MPKGLTEILQQKDRVVENAVAIGSHLNTGYPFNLTAEQVEKMIYFFGARKLSAKALQASARTGDFTTDETRMVNKIFDWMNFVYRTPDERKSAYRAVTARFKSTLVFLRGHPAYITTEIKRALEEGGYRSVLKNIVMVVTENGQIQPRVVTTNQKKDITPIGQMDTLMWEFQNVALDKLRMIIDTIDLKDVKKANLGMKSKALRDIYSVVHMVRLGNKNPNLTLVNVNVNSESKDKMSAYSSYVTKNREA